MHATLLHCCSHVDEELHSDSTPTPYRARSCRHGALPLRTATDTIVLYRIDISSLGVDFVRHLVLVEHLFPASAAGWWMSS